MQVIGQDDITQDLIALGVKIGDGLFVHSALSQIGHVVGGPRGLIEGLIAVVGQNGLIGMPGFSRDAYDPFEGAAPPNEATRARIKAQMPGYDPALSNVRQNGSVAEAFRSWPGVRRSLHPTSSVLLWGADAEGYAADHDALDWPTGPASPWGRLCARPDMKILLIGVMWNRCSALHAAESRAPHRRSVMRHFLHDGRWIDAPDVADDNGRLFPLVGADFEASGAVRIGKVGAAEARICSYADLVAFGADWLDARNMADGIETQ